MLHFLMYGRKDCNISEPGKKENCKCQLWCKSFVICLMKIHVYIIWPISLYGRSSKHILEMIFAHTLSMCPAFLWLTVAIRPSPLASLEGYVVTKTMDGCMLFYKLRQTTHLLAFVHRKPSFESLLEEVSWQVLDSLKWFFLSIGAWSKRRRSSSSNGFLYWICSLT